MSEPKPIRVLFTASRSLNDRQLVLRALSNELAKFPMDRPAVLVHGACTLGGGDALADDIWRSWQRTWPTLFELPEKHAAKDHKDPKARNLHMIKQGADVCIAVASKWASGTGHCARNARLYGIPTYDWGVSTLAAGRPDGDPTLEFGKGEAA